MYKVKYYFYKCEAVTTKYFSPWPWPCTVFAFGNPKSSNSKRNNYVCIEQQGKLGDGRLVAVKQLSVASQQGKSQFLAEIATISAVQHRNLVKLYGCCLEGDKRLLVYEYLENKSLDQLLFGTGKNNNSNL